MKKREEIHENTLESWISLDLLIPGYLSLNFLFPPLHSAPQSFQHISPSLDSLVEYLTLIHSKQTWSIWHPKKHPKTRQTLDWGYILTITTSISMTISGPSISPL